MDITDETEGKEETKSCLFLPKSLFVLKALYRVSYFVETLLRHNHRHGFCFPNLYNIIMKYPVGLTKTAKKMIRKINKALMATHL